MGIYLNPENSMFQTMLDSACYVDKSDIISFMNRMIDRENRFVAVSRPRRLPIHSVVLLGLGLGQA